MPVVIVTVAGNSHSKKPVASIMPPLLQRDRRAEGLEQREADRAVARELR